jgi:eukaryotic-like serine/threonine-protein kinase
MTPERWERIQDLYYATRAYADGDRARFLAHACAGDDALRREVQALVDQPVSTGSFIDLLGGPASAHLGLSARANLTGQQFGTYRVLSLLGSGGMGEVYRAHDAELGRDVAIKVLPARFRADPERLARFDSEARMLAALNHPHIGAIYGVEHVNGVPALVLELVEGDTLACRLRCGPVAPQDALAIARQIADALEAAHRKGIIHRDLKPANIKTTPDGVVKVLDFGLAKAMASEVVSTQEMPQAPTAAVDATRVGVILGTAAYMSPEQARGLAVDTRADIWAFGCVLFEMLTGRPPFTGHTVEETLAAILEREPEWKGLPSATPKAIRELVRQCLQKDRSLRLQNIAEARDTIDRAQQGWNGWQVAAIAAAAVATLAVGAGVLWREPLRPVDRSEWIQLTQLPDSVIHPALSPDGRMVAFVRAASNRIVPFARGQVFVKVLPDGEPVQLTHDNTDKMSPVFSPDGSRIAYTAVNDQFEWDTWTVSVPGGEPQLWLRNASGLVWTDPGRILFAEMKKSPHMGIVAAEETRRGQYDVYVPTDVPGMAHLAYASPDRKWVLLVEMDANHAWTPCRVVPMDGSSQGRLVGPPGAACTFGAWSPDGRWIYLTSNAGGSNHIWRQRFPDGEPEQITSGPTEEEGIAIAPDGRSLVTAVALRNSSLWLRDPNGERQISLERNAVDAKFTRDGTKLLYKVVSSLGQYPLPGELRVADVQSGRSEALISGVETLEYDLAADGQQVVIEAADRDGLSRLWVVGLDRRSPPRQIPIVEGRQPRFGAGGEIFFRRVEGAAEGEAGPLARASVVYVVRPDGTGLRKVLEQPIPLLGEVSPDGRWITGWTSRPGNEGSGWQAFPLDGRPPVLLGSTIGWQWSRRGDSITVSGGPIPRDRSYVVPLAAGELLPPIPPGGFRSEKELAALPGARRIDAVAVPGPSPDVYAFYRTTTQRNLYRIPIR